MRATLCRRDLAWCRSHFYVIRAQVRSEFSLRKDGDARWTSVTRTGSCAHIWFRIIHLYIPPRFFPPQNLTTHAHKFPLSDRKIVFNYRHRYRINKDFVIKHVMYRIHVWFVYQMLEFDCRCELQMYVRTAHMLIAQSETSPEGVSLFTLPLF